MYRLLFIFILFLLPAELNAQSAFYGARYLNTMDSAFLQRVAAMEKQKDSEITNVVFYSQHERQQIANLQKFLKSPFSGSFSPPDYNAVQNAMDKYYQASKIQLLYDLDITAQPKQVLGFTMQTFHPAATLKTFSIAFKPEPTPVYYNAQPFRPEQTAAYMSNLKDAARTNGELKIFFPETFKMLKYLEPTGQFPDFGNIYKKLISEDLNRVFENVFKYIDNYPYNAVPDIETSFIKERNINAIRNDDNYFLFRLNLDIMDRATDGVNPVTLMEYYDEKYYDKSLLTKTKKGIGDKFSIAVHGLTLVAGALRDTLTSSNVSKYWISREQLSQMVPSEKRLFAALIYHTDPEYFNQVCNLGGAPTESKIEEAILEKVEALINQINLFQDFIQAHDNSLNPVRYRRWLQLNLDLFTANCFTGNELKSFGSNREDLLEMYENRLKNDATANVYYTLKIYNELLQSRAEFSKETHTFWGYATFLTELSEMNSNEQLQELLKRYIPRK
jgi:hypothetical protein